MLGSSTLRTHAILLMLELVVVFVNRNLELSLSTLLSNTYIDQSYFPSPGQEPMFTVSAVGMCLLIVSQARSLTY